MVFEPFEADELDQRFGFSLGIREVTSPRLQTETNVAENRTPGEERFIVFLKKQDQIRRRPADLFAVDNDLPRRGSQQASDRHEQRGLAATRGPDERNEFSRFDLARDLADGHCGFAARLTIALRQTWTSRMGTGEIDGAWDEFETWSIGVMEFWKTSLFLLSCSNTLIHSIPLRLRRDVADHFPRFDRPGDQFVFLSQIDGDLEIFFRHGFFEDGQADLAGHVRIQPGPFYHRARLPSGSAWMASMPRLIARTKA